jgi:hypothetical protein
VGPCTATHSHSCSTPLTTARASIYQHKGLAEGQHRPAQGACCSLVARAHSESSLSPRHVLPGPQAPCQCHARPPLAPRTQRLVTPSAPRKSTGFGAGPGPQPKHPHLPYRNHWHSMPCRRANPSPPYIPFLSRARASLSPCFVVTNAKRSRRRVSPSTRPSWRPAPPPPPPRYTSMFV